MNDFNDPDGASAKMALCLMCGTEALIGDAAGYSLNPDFLSRVNQAWFQSTIIRKLAPKK